MSKKMRKFFFLLILAAGVAGVPAPVSAATPSGVPVPSGAAASVAASVPAGKTQSRRILIVSTFHLSHVWTRKVCSELDTRFGTANSPWIIDYLELNSIRDRQGNFAGKFEAYLPRICKGDYAMVVGLVDDANNLIVKHYDSFPKVMPVVLCGYRDIPPHFKERHPNATGFTGDYDLKKTIDLGLKLYPNTEEIAVICDDFTSGRLLNERAQKLMLDFKRCRISLLYGGQYTTSQVLQRVAIMPKDTLVIFAPWRNFSKDKYTSLEQVAAELSQCAKHPFLVFTDVLLGHGALGGFLSDGHVTGQAIADLMQRLLKGEKPQNIPFMEMPMTCVLDMKLFDREKLDRGLIPDGAILLNETHPIYEEYPTASLLVFILFILLLFALSFIIGMHIRYRRQSREQVELLIRSNAKNERLAEEQRTTLEALDDGLVVIDSNAFIVMANDTAAAMIGWKKEEMIGKPLNTLCGTLSSLNNEKGVSPSSRVLKDGKTVKAFQNVILCSHSGKRRPISGNICTLRNHDGEVSGAVILFRDMTQEYRRHESVAAALHSLEVAAELAHITYSKVSLTGGFLNSLGKDHGANWGAENNRPLPPSLWIHPEDLSRFESAWSELSRKKSDGFKLDYRSCHKNQVRYFTMAAKRISGNNPNAAPTYNCIIQDVSEGERNRRSLVETNDFLNTIIDLLPAILLIKDPHDHFKFVKVSRRFADMIGRRTEEIIGKTDYDFFDPELAKKYQEDDMKVAIAGGSIKYTETLPGPGGISTLQTMKTGITAPGGRRLVLMAATDITEMDTIKKKAVRSAELLTAVIDNAPVGLLLKDPDDDFRYVLWNAELGRNTNTPVSAVVGKTDWEWDVYRDRAEYFRCQDEQVMRTNRTLALEEELPLTAGGSVFYRTAKIPISLSGGKRYLLGSFVNITEMKQLAAQLGNTVSSQKDLLESEKIYNECLQIITMADNYENAVNSCLAAVGKHCGADRCFIYCVRGENKLLDHAFEWTREGVKSHLNIFFGNYLIENQIFWHELITKKVCLINDFSQRQDLLNELKSDYGENFDMTAILLFSIFDENGFYGVFGLSSVHAGKTFSSIDEKVLGSSTKLFLLLRERGYRKFELDRAVMIREMIFANIDIPIVLFDKNGKLVNINESGCRNLGVTQREALELPCHTLFCRSVTPPLDCPVQNAIKTGKKAVYSLKCNNRDYHINATPIFDERGEIIYVLECGLDMTDFNVSQRKLVVSLESAKAGEQAKNNFISTMNHELRTPLNAVIGFSDLLEAGGCEPEEQRGFIKAIGDSGRALLNMVNDILDISKLDAGHFELTLSRVDFNVVLQELAAQFRQSAAKKNLEFKLVLPAFLPEIFIDVPRVRQVLIHLVVNATKFTQIGEVSLTVLFEPVQNEWGRLKIEVADTGIGIASETLPKIFDAFTQDEKVRSSRAYQGSGLGLAIVKKLVDVMHGEITANSCENVGTTFTVLLNEVKYDFSVAPVSSTPIFADTQKSLLIVDDLPMNLRILEALLKRTGHKCIAAESGEAALMLMKHEKFDIVLTDIWMPDMDGVQLAQKIRQDGNGGDKTIFAITADAEWHEGKYAKIFDGLYHKPMTLEDIRTMFAAIERKKGNI